MVCLKRTSWRLAGALVCLMIAGCGPGGEKLVIVNGKLLNGGKPVEVAEFYEGENCVFLEFYPIDAEGNLVDKATWENDVAEDGSFSMSGPMGDGIPAGRYKVAAFLYEEESQDTSEKIDTWKGKFDVDNTPFIWDYEKRRNGWNSLRHSEGAIELKPAASPRRRPE